MSAGKQIAALLLLLTAGHAAGATATVTAYCACTICCGKNAKGITAAGTRPLQGRTIAAPRSVPLGAKVRVQGLPGVFTVEDRTARRFDGRWDVYFERHQDAKNFGKRKLDVRE